MYIDDYMVNLSDATLCQKHSFMNLQKDYEIETFRNFDLSWHAYEPVGILNSIIV